MRQLVLASRSVGKLRELSSLCCAAGYEILGLDDVGITADDAVESRLELGMTFEENALAKLRYYRQFTDCAVLSEDSGLCVDALGGAPGVHSKRWTGRTDVSGAVLDQANVVALRARMQGVRNRRAQYVCVAALWQDGVERVARGETGGTLLDAPRGGGGFGYDPIFLSDELGVTFAEAGADLKASVSHRGRAIRLLFGRTVDFGGDGSTITGPIGA